MAYDVTEYQIGGGEVHFAKWTGSTPPSDPADYDEIGSCPSAEVTVKQESAVHQTPRAGLLEDDDETVTMVGYDLKFACDQFNVDTLAMYFMATEADSNTLYPLENTDQYYAIKFVPKYTKGELWAHHFWKLQSKPSGSCKLISGKEYNSLEFELKGLSDYANHPTNRWWSLSKPTA